MGARYTGSGYPQGENEWKISDSAVYPNISETDQTQVQQLIDALLNFAPLPELAAALNNSSFDENAKREMRAILAERYLAGENFAEAKKFITDPSRQQIVDRLTQLTGDRSGGPPEKAERMMKIGDTWAEARGQLLRLPLDSKMHIYNRRLPFAGLERRDNGRTLQLANLEDQLDDRDELHHASRWWIRAARALPGTPIDAQARLKALEALPQEARSSQYAEQRAREINLGQASQEIYDKLRSECPASPEAQRFAAYWSVPPLVKQDSEWSNPLPVPAL